MLLKIKALICILGVFALSQNFALGFKVKFKQSKIHNLVSFYFAMQHGPHQNQMFTYLYDKSKFNIPAWRDRFSQWEREIDLNYEIEWGETGSKIRPYKSYTQGAVVALSISAQSIEEYNTLLADVVPASSRIPYIKALKQLEPLYDSIFMKSCWEPTERYVKQIQQLADRKQIGDFYAQTGQFFGSEVDQEGTILVGVIGFPFKTGMANATPMQQVVSMSVLTKDSSENGLNGMLAVLLHEMAHVQYKAQLPALQLAQEKHFLSRPGQYKVFAYQLADEALATALGNGWINQQLTGVLDTGAWYHEPYINKLAKAIYPTVAQYMASGKVMDTAFINQYVAVTGQILGEELWTVGNMVRSCQIMTNDTSTNIHALYGYLRNWGHLSIYGLSNPIVATGWERLGNELGTRIVVLTGKQQPDQAFWRQAVLHLKIQKPSKALKTDGWYYLTRAKDGVPVLICKLNQLTDFETLTKKIKPTTLIRPDAVIKAL